MLFHGIVYLNVTPLSQNQGHIVSTVEYNPSVFGHLVVLDETNTQCVLKAGRRRAHCEWGWHFPCMWDNLHQFLLISNSLLGVVLGELSLVVVFWNAKCPNTIHYIFFVQSQTKHVQMDPSYFYRYNIHNVILTCSRHVYNWNTVHVRLKHQSINQFKCFKF